MRVVGYIGTAYVGGTETFLRLVKMEDSLKGAPQKGGDIWYIWTETGFELLTTTAQVERALKLQRGTASEV